MTQAQFETQTKYDLLHHRRRAVMLRSLPSRDSNQQRLLEQSEYLLQHPAEAYNSVSLYDEAYLYELDEFALIQPPGVDRLIFVDVDGVLINLTTLLREEAVPDCVACLNWLTDQTGAGIVISSSWRKTGLTVMRAKFREWGVTGQVVGATPYFGRVIVPPWRGFPRGMEIQAYLSLVGPVKSFVILDDEADMLHLLPKLVQTSYTTGLTPAAAELARQILAG